MNIQDVISDDNKTTEISTFSSGDLETIASNSTDSENSCNNDENEEKTKDDFRESEESEEEEEDVQKEDFNHTKGHELPSRYLSEYEINIKNRESYYYPPQKVILGGNKGTITPNGYYIIDYPMVEKLFNYIVRKYNDSVVTTNDEYELLIKTHSIYAIYSKIKCLSGYITLNKQPTKQGVRIPINNKEMTKLVMLLHHPTPKEKISYSKVRTMLRHTCFIFPSLSTAVKEIITSCNTCTLKKKKAPPSSPELSSPEIFKATSSKKQPQERSIKAPVIKTKSPKRKLDVDEEPVIKKIKEEKFEYENIAVPIKNVNTNTKSIDEKFSRKAIYSTVTLDTSNVSFRGYPVGRIPFPIVDIFAPRLQKIMVPNVLFTFADPSKPAYQQLDFAYAGQMAPCSISQDGDYTFFLFYCGHEDSANKYTIVCLRAAEVEPLINDFTENIKPVVSSNYMPKEFLEKYRNSPAKDLANFYLTVGSK